MRTARVSQALRSAIYQEAKKLVGHNPFFECGLHWIGDRLTMNAREWWDDDPIDLDFQPLRGLKEVYLTDDGLCTLDLYATTTTEGFGRGATRELEANVYVTTDGKTVLQATLDSLKVLGREYKGD
jgi:hypothetical protein